jgi:hypothetical protein
MHGHTRSARSTVDGVSGSNLLRMEPMPVAGVLPLSSIMHAPQERWVEGCSTESVAKVKRSQEGVLKYWSHTIHYRSTKEFWFLDACAPPSMVDRVVVAAAFWEQYRGDALPACVGGRARWRRPARIVWGSVDAAVTARRREESRPPRWSGKCGRRESVTCALHGWRSGRREKLLDLPRPLVVQRPAARPTGQGPAESARAFVFNSLDGVVEDKRTARADPDCGATARPGPGPPCGVRTPCGHALGKGASRWLFA